MNFNGICRSPKQISMVIKAYVVQERGKRKGMVGHIILLLQVCGLIDEKANPQSNMQENISP